MPNAFPVWEISASLAWMLTGAVFWFEAQRSNGFPKRWRPRHVRESGWRDEILVTLPICLVGGPFWWIALLISRTMQKLGRRRWRGEPR